MSNDSIGKVFLDLETNAAPFQQQLNGIAGKSTNMVKSAFMGLGKVMAGAFAVTKLVQFGKASIDLASDLAEVQNVVDVVFGESANQINNFAKTALESYGLSELSAKRYSSTMGAMLKSMGLSGDAVLDMSQSITALAGDMASFYNLNGDDAFNKIRAGISGETEPLKQLGINMSVANMEAFALSQGITKAYQKMSQSEQALLRYNYLLSVTADAQGDFARTSDGWANQTRILSEQFNSLKATLGSAFIAVLTPVVRMLNWVISKLQIAASYFKAFVEAVTGVKAETSSASSGMTDIADSATEAGDATEAAAKKASKALAGFDKLNVLSSGGDSGSGAGGDATGGMSIDIPSLSGVSTAFPEPDTSGVEKVVGKVKSMFSSLKSYVTTSFAPSIKSWGNAFKDLKEPVKNTFDSVKGSVSDFWKNTLKPFGGYVLDDFVPSIVNKFSETFAPIFTDTMSFALEEFAKDFEFACQQINNIVNDILKPAMDLIKTIVTDALDIIKKEWDKSGKKLLDGFGKLRDGIKEIWNNLYKSIIKPVWDKILSGLSSLWDEHLKPLWESLVGFFAKLGEAILTVWNNFLAPLIDWMVKTFGPIITEIFGAIWDRFEAVAGNIIDAIKHLFDALSGLMDFIIGVFSGDWERAWEGMKKVFENIWEYYVDLVKACVNNIIGIINTLLTVMTEALNFVIRSINKIKIKIPDWVPRYGGKSWSPSISEVSSKQIPYLARGGIIDQPTLAMVGERGKEAVVPLENTAFADSIANAIMRVLMPLFNNNNGVGKNNDGGTQVIVLKVGEYELGRITVGAINKYHNVIGKVELEV